MIKQRGSYEYRAYIFNKLIYSHGNVELGVCLGADPEHAGGAIYIASDLGTPQDPP